MSWNNNPKNIFQSKQPLKRSLIQLLLLLRSSLRVSASVFPRAHCEILVLPVPCYDILKWKTGGAVRSEADVSVGGRLGTRLLSRVADQLSVLVGFHLVSVANTFSFVLDSPAFNNSARLAGLLLHKKKKHDFTFMETGFDNKPGIRQTRPQAKNNTVHLSRTCFWGGFFSL